MKNLHSNSVLLGCKYFTKPHFNTTLIWCHEKAMLVLYLRYEHIFLLPMFLWHAGLCPSDQLNRTDADMENKLLSCDVTTKVLVKWSLGQNLKLVNQVDLVYQRHQGCNHNLLSSDGCDGRWGNIQPVSSLLGVDDINMQVMSSSSSILVEQGLFCSNPDDFLHPFLSWLKIAGCSRNIGYFETRLLVD